MFIQVMVRGDGIFGTVTTVVIDGAVTELYCGDTMKINVGLHEFDSYEKGSDRN